MSSKADVGRYRTYLARLSYPEYALNHVDEFDMLCVNDRQMLNLSLWNDQLPPGVMETVLRVLPKVVGAYALAQDKALITALAKKLGAHEDTTIITAGADDALRIASQYSIRPTTPVLIPTPCFGRYVYHAMVYEADISYVCFDTYPYELDIMKISATVTAKRIECLYIASPNNPTGHMLSRESIKQLLDAVSCAVILDESLLMIEDYASHVALVEEYPNLFICGSFSKLYGLAGLRIGYLVASPIHARQLKQLASPFGVDALGIEVAKYMLSQDEWIRQRIATMHASIALVRDMQSPVFRLTRTTAPIALLEYGGPANLYEVLRGQGIMTVAANEFPGLVQTNAVRIIIKNVNDMRRLKRTLVSIA